MDCTSCLNELEAFTGGSLPDSRRLQVEAHLNTCEECLRSYKAMRLASEVIEQEKTIQPDPYLSARIMAVIDKEVAYETIKFPVYQRALRASIISLAIAASIFIGILAGNIYKPVPDKLNVPEEVIYMNDAFLESVNAFSE